MEKVWYVLKSDHYTGPYNTKDILCSLDTGDIDANSLIWREGHKDWDRVVSYDEFTHLFEKRVVAPIVSDDEWRKPTDTAGAVLAFNTDIVTDDAPPELPDELVMTQIARLLKKDDKNVVFRTKTPSLGLTPEEELLIAQELTKVAPLPERVLDLSQQSTSWTVRLSRMGLIIAATLAILSLGALYIHTEFFPAKPARPTSLSLKYFNLFAKTLAGPFEQKLEVAAIATKDLSTIWVASNAPGNGELSLTLEAIKGKVLTDIETVLNAEATYTNHFAEMKNFELVKGSALVPGYYKATIHGRNIGETIPWWKPWLRKTAPLEFTRETEILLTQGTQGEFDVKLTAFKKQLQNTKEKYLLDLSEKSRTLSSLAGTSEKILSTWIKKINKGKDLRQYEKAYAVQVGMVLGDITLTNQDISAKLRGPDEKMGKSYQKLADYGKEIGAIAVMPIDVLASETKISSKKKSQVVTEFSTAIAKIQKRLNEETTTFETDLADLQAWLK